MNYLITGGMGFIGSHLYDRLLQYGENVKIFDHYSKKTYFDFEPHNEHRIIGNICNYNEVIKAVENVDIIIHLAGVLGTDYLMSYPEMAIRTNILGTINVLEASRKTGSTICYLSLLPKWKNLYMITKNTSADLCKIYHEHFGVKTITLKATHIYGARQKWKPVVKAIPQFIVSALNDNPLVVYGKGKQLMDLIYIDDAINGILKSVKTEAAIGKSLEFGSGKGYEVAEVANKIIKLCNSSSKIEYEKMRPGEPNDTKSFIPANTKEQLNLLGFKTQTDMESGLIKTINWYRKFA